MSKRLSAVLILIVCLVATIASAADAPTAHLVLLHVNDVHGQTLGQNEDGKPFGGYARLSTAVEKVRQEVGRDNVILIHAGDEFSRGDAMTLASAGASSITLMNQIGFSLFTPGNGDFYGGQDNLQKRIREASFPVLASNVSYRLGGKDFAQPMRLIKAGDVQIGVMGLCFLRKEHPSSLPLSVEDPISAARKIVPQLREKADLVIAVNHIGLQEDRRLAGEVPGIDLIIGGHSHSALPRGNWVTAPDGRPVLIAQAGEYLHYLGRVDLHLVKQDGIWSLDDATAQLLPLDASVPEDPAIKATIARLWPATAPAKTPSQPAVTP